MKHLLQLIALFILLTSCASKKTHIEYRDRVQKDTIILTTERIVTDHVVDTLKIESACDSTGVLKDFEKSIVTPKAKVVLKNIDGAIHVEVNIDSIVDSRVNEFKSNYDKQIEKVEIEIIRNVVPKWCYVTILTTILFLYLWIRW